MPTEQKCQQGRTKRTRHMIGAGQPATRSTRLPMSLLLAVLLVTLVDLNCGDWSASAANYYDGELIDYNVGGRVSMEPDGGLLRKRRQLLETNPVPAKPSGSSSTTTGKPTESITKTLVGSSTAKPPTSPTTKVGPTTAKPTVPSIGNLTSSTTSKPAGSTTKQPASSTSTKPAGPTNGKPSGSTTSKPAGSTPSKPAGSSTSKKPPSSSTAKPAGPTTGKPAGSTTKKPSGSSAKPAGSSTTNKPPGPPTVKPILLDATSQRPKVDQIDRPDLGGYNARDVAIFLDSHESHALTDPRVYFTRNSPLDALGAIRFEMTWVPDRLRFAYAMRSVNEFGRKVASRMNMFNGHTIALLQKSPDGLGSKPGIEAYLDAMRQAFTAEVDDELANGPPKVQSKPYWMPNGLRPMVVVNRTKNKDRTGSPVIDLVNFRVKGAGGPKQPATISALIGDDKGKESMFNTSLGEIASEFANLLVRLGTRQMFEGPDSEKWANFLGAALKHGAKTMIEVMEQDDKFKPQPEVVRYMNQLLSKTMDVVKQHIKNKDIQTFADSSKSANSRPKPQIVLRSHSLMDQTGMVGVWNNYLFEDLGTSERVVRTFASMLDGTPDDVTKARFVNMHMAQVKQELSKTMTSFVSLQVSKRVDNSSEHYLLDASRNLIGLPSKTPIRDDYAVVKNRMPARCYLGGRRWRLLLNKAMKHYDKRQDVINMLVDRVNQIKASMLAKQGSELERVCLPRLEVGLKGWGINGEPPGEVDAVANKFPLRNPIEGLNKDEDPFTGGARMGYRLGFMIGYNDQRNQSIEMESGQVPKSAAEWVSVNGTAEDADKKKKRKRPEDKGNNKDREIDYLSKASYRQGTTAGARRALEIACREGYMATLRVSVRAGMLLPLEAGSSLALLKASNFAEQAGGEAGRNFVNKYLVEKETLDEKSRSKLMEVGRAYGSLAGRIIGEKVGAIVGHEAALEAYRRAISRGGKVTSAKFHLDEYLAGAMVGFDYGMKEGGRVEQSANVNPSAPMFFKLTVPEYRPSNSATFGPASNDKNKTANTNSTSKAELKTRSSLIQLPPSLPTTSFIMNAHDNSIKPLPDKIIEEFHKARNHTRVTGTFKGTYHVAKEVKKGLQRLSFANLTYDLEVQAIGFAMNDVTYLSLSGKINNANVLHGSLVAKNMIG